MKDALKKFAVMSMSVTFAVALLGGCSSSNKPSVQSATEESQEEVESTEVEEEAPAEEEVDYAHLSLGEAASFNDGTTVVVNEVEGGFENYDGSAVTRVNVTYVNDGDDKISFNPYDWQGEDANGVQRSQTFYTNGTDELNSGNLAAGGTVTGNIYFDGDLTRVLYQNNIFLEDTQVGWDVQ